MTARIWRGVVGLIATGDLLGMLTVDAIFDVEKDVSVFKAYYCTLLDSMSRFPEVLRVALPCLLLAKCVGANCVLQGRSRGDVIAAFVPGTILTHAHTHTHTHTHTQTYIYIYIYVCVCVRDKSDLSSFVDCAS